MMASAGALFEVGQKAYAQAQYEQAYDLFSEVIRSNTVGHVDRLTLLDHRIGTLVKLKKLDPALKDAKSMVREARRDGRGYLRCGQLASLAGDHSGAVRWYEHGTKNVPSSDRLHAILEAKLTNTRGIVADGLVKRNAKDPLTTLPFEIVEMIVQCLDHRLLVTLTRVSKPWRDLLTRMQPLCDTLDFSGAIQDVSYQNFRASLRRLKTYPRKAIICSLTDPASKLLPEHLRRWFLKNSLEHLEVDDKRYCLKVNTPTVPGLRKIVLGRATAVSFSRAMAILRQYTHLGHARFDNVISGGTEPMPDWFADFEQPALKHLEIRYIGSGIKTIAVELFRPFCNLETIRCSALGLCHRSAGEFDLSTLPLRELEFSSSRLDKLPQLPPTLACLNLSEAMIDTQLLEDQGFAQPSLPQLRHLDIFNTVIRQPIIAVLVDLSANSSLETLHLHEVGKAWRNGNGDFFPECALLNHHSLKNLRLRSQWLSDYDTECFISCFPKLENLRLELARISGVFVAALVRRADSKLKYLCLEDCEHVSRDAVDYARSLGVTVEVKSKQDTQGMRRVVQAH